MSGFFVNSEFYIGASSGVLTPPFKKEERIRGCEREGIEKKGYLAFMRTLSRINFVIECSYELP